MFGERLAGARKRRGLTQWDLAVALGERYTQSMISTVEHGHSFLLLNGAIRAAQELNVSLDWLVGLTDDPGPSLVPSLIPGPPPRVSVRTSYATDPAPIIESDLDLEYTKAFTVLGDDSMHPTVPSASTILVDCQRKELRDRRIFLYRANGGPLQVKRAVRWPRRAWWWCSDNPDVDKVRHEEDDEIVGEVRWIGQRAAR